MLHVRAHAPHPARAFAAKRHWRARRHSYRVQYVTKVKSGGLHIQLDIVRARRRNERNERTATVSESRIDNEGMAFHERVREGYLALAKAEPERFRVIDGRAPIGEVGQRIQEALRDRV